tara:strand:+ start:7439 stop:8083 length:645 start_codon:yes stop_codon:yes gene_type:complete
MILQEINKRIIKFSETTENKKILDFGCGENKYKKFFSEKNHFIGVDIKVSGRGLEKKKPDIFFDGISLPFENSEFDIVICTEVLEHVEDFENSLNEIHRVLKPGGKGIISMPFITSEHEEPFDFRRFTSFGINSEFKKAGFEIESLEKILPGHNAIRQLLYSEMLQTENENKINFFVKFFIKSIFRVSFRILGYFYNFRRIYYDNFFIIKKINK